MGQEIHFREGEMYRTRGGNRVWCKSIRNLGPFPIRCVECGGRQRAFDYDAVGRYMGHLNQTDLDLVVERPEEPTITPSEAQPEAEENDGEVFTSEEVVTILRFFRQYPGFFDEQREEGN